LGKSSETGWSLEGGGKEGVEEELGEGLEYEREGARRGEGRAGRIGGRGVRGRNRKN